MNALIVCFIIDCKLKSYHTNFCSFGTLEICCIYPWLYSWYIYGVFAFSPVDFSYCPPLCLMIALFDLQKEFPGMEGFSSRNLWRMRTFYLAYEKLPPMVAEIGWSHNVLNLEKCKR